MLALFAILFTAILLVTYKYILFLVKRFRLLLKLKKTNTKVIGNSKLWLFGTRRGES